MKKEKYTISTGLVLMKQVKVVETNPVDNWLISVEKPNGETTMMHKAVPLKLYRPLTQGVQSLLFSKPKTDYDRLKEKHLIQ